MNQFRSATHRAVVPIYVHMCLSGAHGNYSTTSRRNGGPRLARVASRARDTRQASPRCQQGGYLYLRADRPDRREPATDRPGYTALDATSEPRWGAAYRLGLTREAPHKCEGPEALVLNLLMLAGSEIHNSFDSAPVTSRAFVVPRRRRSSEVTPS
jgi:hypothetical protein